MADDGQTMDVTMPDGGVVKGVPVGTPKEAILQKYQGSRNPPVLEKNNPPFPVPKDQQMRPADILDGRGRQPQKEPSTQDQGLMGNISQDIKNRFNTGTDIMKSDQNPLSKGLQMGGKIVAGTANDIMGEAAKSAYKAVPDIGDWKEKVEGGTQKLLNTTLGKAAVSAAQKGGLAYVNWAKDHPEAAANVESLVDIASVIPAGKAAGAIGNAAGKVAGEATGISGIAKGVMAPNANKMAAITDNMHKQATATIENLKNVNVKFKPKYLDSLVKDLGDHPDLKTQGERSVRPSTTEAVSNITDSIQKGDTSLRNLIGFHDNLNTIIAKGGQDGNAALKAQNSLDKILTKIPEFQKYLKEWGQYKTGEQVATATALADTSSAKSRAAFQKIVDSKYFNSLSPTVQSLTKIAAKGKASGKFLDAVGSLKNLMGAKVRFVGKHLPALEAVGALSAGHPAVAAGIGGVMAASKGGKVTQRGIGADVLKALQEGK